MKNKRKIAGTVTAFQNETRLASGPVWNVAIAMKTAINFDTKNNSYLCFDDQTGAFIDLDLSGSDEEIVARLKPDETVPMPSVRAKAGRPKLGVVSKEVTLLPRHWAWLSSQSGGASASLRKLVDQARKSAGGSERSLNAQASTDRFMRAMLGDQAGYEDAARALYRGDKVWFLELIQDWPSDLKSYVLQMAEPAFLPSNGAK